MDLPVLIQGISSVASSPLAFGAYITVIIFWAFISYKKLYFSNIERSISHLPEQDRIKVLIKDYGLKPKGGLSSEQYLTHITRRYFFYGFIIIMIVIFLLASLGFQRYMELDKLKAEGQAIKTAYEAFRRGTSAADDSNFQNAAGKLEEALRLNPTAAGYSNLSDIYDEINEPDKAISASQLALKLDPDNPTAENMLGLLYKNKGDLINAEKHLIRALEIFNTQNKVDDEFLVSVLGNLGNIYYEMADANPTQDKKYKLAQIALEKYYQPALNLKGSIQGKRFIAILLGNAANCYRILGEYNKSEALMFESISIKEKIVKSSPESTSLGNGYINLADIYLKQGALSRSLIYVMKSEEIFKVSNNAIGLGSAELIMAMILKARGDIKSARTHALNARAIFSSASLDLYTHKAQIILENLDLVDSKK